MRDYFHLVQAWCGLFGSDSKRLNNKIVARSLRLRIPARISILFFALIFHNTNTAFAFDLDDLINTPRTQACSLFGEDQETVEFFVDMVLEETEIRLKVPKIYLEDRYDHVQGARHRSQLFRVMIENFLPVTRRQTTGLRQSGNFGYARILIGDRIDMEGIADVELRGANPGRHRKKAEDLYQSIKKLTYSY